MPRSSSLPAMSALDSAAFVAGVVVPTIAKGVIIRRRAVVGLAERFGLDMRAVRQMQKLRAKYGDGPLLVRNPIRPQAVLLNGYDVRRVLWETPEPFSPASREKREALAHFEPHGSLISTGPERTVRRAFNDAALDSGCPVHRLGSGLVAVVEEEANEIFARAADVGELGWDLFFEGWFRLVRRIVLGREARDDRQLTDMIASLRRRANWAFVAPRNRSLRSAFHQRLHRHLERAEPESLAAVVARMPAGAETEPTHQVAQWLFAFDPAGMATFRTLALLLAHPQALRRARTEAGSGADATDLPYLRAALIEALRLYPTTPMVLRQTTRDTEWAKGVLPERSGVLMFAPFFHRDDERLPNAHRFDPSFWLHKDPADAAPLIPFSAGPGACPARHLVPMLGSAFLRAILRREGRLELRNPQRLDPMRPLPGTLDPFTLRIGMPAGG